MSKYLSRAKRFEQAMMQMPDRSELESLRDELQNWLDNMPDNLQSSNKASVLQDSIDKIDNILSALDDIDNNMDLEFPSLYG